MEGTQGVLKNIHTSYIISFHVNMFTCISIQLLGGCSGFSSKTVLTSDTIEAAYMLYLELFIHVSFIAK